MLDPISDMLTRIRNAQLARKSTVRLPASKIKKAIMDVFLNHGFVEAVRVVEEEKKKFLEIDLKYKRMGHSVKMPYIQEIRRVSKEGQRMYVQSEEIRKVKNGYGLAVISTSKGVLSGEDARKLGVGGEYICLVW
jgi:small subunit ribosomal protein S8